MQCLDDDIEIDVDIDSDTKDSKKYIHVKFLNNLISKGNHNYYKNENINNRMLKRVKSERVNLVSLKKITRTVKQYERVYNNKKVRRNTGLDKPKGGVKLKNAIKDRTSAVKSKRVYVKKTDSEGNVVAKGVKRKRRPKKEKKQKGIFFSNSFTFHTLLVCVRFLIYLLVGSLFLVLLICGSYSIHKIFFFF